MNQMKRVREFEPFENYCFELKFEDERLHVAEDLEEAIAYTEHFPPRLRNPFLSVSDFENAQEWMFYCGQHACFTDCDISGEDLYQLAFRWISLWCYECSSRIDEMAAYDAYQNGYYAEMATLLGTTEQAIEAAYKRLQIQLAPDDHCGDPPGEMPAWCELVDVRVNRNPLLAWEQLLDRINGHSVEEVDWVREGF